MTTPPAQTLSRRPIGRLADLLDALRRGEDDRSRTQRDALAVFGIRVSSAGLLYLSQIAMARWMGSFEYGIYVFVWTWVLVLGGLSHAGISASMIRLIPQLREQERFDALRGLLFGGRLAALALSTLVALVAGGLVWTFASVLSDHYALPIMLALFCLPLFALTDVHDGVGRGYAWMGVALVPPYVLRPLLLLAAMGTSIALGLPADATTAALAAIAATWLTAAIQFAVVQVKLSKALPRGDRTYEPVAWATTALPLLLITACDMVLQNADVLVVSQFLSPSDVGIYFAAAKTMSLIMFVHYAVGSAVANRFATLHARGDHAALKAFVRDAVNWTFWPSLGAAMFILILGRPLLSLFGPSFTSGYPVMFILVLGFLIRSAMGPSEFLLNMVGQQRRCARSLMIAAAVSVSLNLVLVPIWGLVGAASATAMALVTAALLNHSAAARHLGLEIAIWSNVGPRRD